MRTFGNNSRTIVGTQCSENRNAPEYMHHVRISKLAQLANVTRISVCTLQGMLSFQFVRSIQVFAQPLTKILNSAWSLARHGGQPLLSNVNWHNPWEELILVFWFAAKKNKVESITYAPSVEVKIDLAGHSWSWCSQNSYCSRWTRDETIRWNE